MKLLDGQRGWLVGAPIGFAGIWLLWAIAPDQFQTHQWLLWIAVGVGVLFGRAAKREPRLSKAVATGLGHSLLALAAFGGVTLAVVAVDAYSADIDTWFRESRWSIGLMVSAYFAMRFWEHQKELIRNVRTLQEQVAQSNYQLEAIRQRIGDAERY